MNHDYAKMREAAIAILSLLIPSHVSVLQFVIDNCSDEILATEESANAFLELALQRRKVSAESITAAEAFIAEYLEIVPAVTKGFVSEETWLKVQESAMIVEIQSAITEAKKAIPTVAPSTNGKREDFRRTFARAMGIAVESRGQIKAELTVLYNRHCPMGPATNLESLDREAIRAEALAMKLAIITLA